MDSILGQALLLGYLLAIAYLVTKEIPKKNTRENNFSSTLEEENRLKIEEILRERDQALHDLTEMVMNASFEQYFVATVLSVILIWLLYSILRNFFFLLSTLF